MIFFLIVFFVLIFDQGLKFLVKTLMNPGQSIPLIKNVLHLTFVQNKGAAFGLFYGKGWLLLIIGAIVIATIIYFHFKLSSKSFYQMPLALILGGSLGNFLDRLFLGHVVDYIDFRIWPVFNLADIMINLGVALLIFKMVFLKEQKDVSHSS